MKFKRTDINIFYFYKQNDSLNGTTVNSCCIIDDNSVSYSCQSKINPLHPKKQNHRTALLMCLCINTNKTSRDQRLERRRKRSEAERWTGREITNATIIILDSLSSLPESRTKKARALSPDGCLTGKQDVKHRSNGRRRKYVQTRPPHGHRDLWLWLQTGSK